VSLPAPSRDGTVSLERTINERASVREFASRELTLDHIGQLLWAASGETTDATSGPTRAAPSAGGLYPVVSYVVAGRTHGLDAGFYRYDPRGHRLALVRDGDLRRRLAAAALGQAPITAAPCVVVLVADYDVTRARYGDRGAERYVHMDAGHAAQNVLLQAQALSLGAVPIGAFSDSRVMEVLGLDLPPLYLIPVGYPRR
jgi:SagB-type dehydrogenase family enzyme